jgi:tetraprenyl-beta-curcumene synthase
LRLVAIESQRKWGNVEGAAAFAVLVPRRHRAAAARAMICFQAAYDYLDMLGERPSADPPANGRRLHSALLVALDPDAAHPDYYEHNLQRDDGGYLRDMLDACRAALATLPSYPLVAPAARRAAERIVEFQSANTGDSQGETAALERWARAATPPGSGLHWWETAAAGGSSLCVYALIALAGAPDLSRSQALGGTSRSPAPGASRAPAPEAVADAYFPWIGALHSLLDNLVDASEDRVTAQHSLIGCYDSPEEAAARMGRLAERSLRAALALPDGRTHALVLAAMASFYLCTPEAAAPAARPVARVVLDALAGPAALTAPVFRVRLRARCLLPRVFVRRSRGAELVM